MKDLRLAFFLSLLFCLGNLRLSAQEAQSLPLNITSNDQLFSRSESGTAKASVSGTNQISFIKDGSKTGESSAVIWIGDVPGRLKMFVNKDGFVCTSHTNSLTVYASSDNSFYRQLGSFNHKSGTVEFDQPLNKDDRYIRFYYDVTSSFLGTNFCAHGWIPTITITEPISFPSSVVTDTITGGVSFTGKFTVNYSNPSGDLILTSSDPNIVLQTTRINGASGQEDSQEISYIYNPSVTGAKHADITVTDEGNNTYSKVLGLNIVTVLPEAPSVEADDNNIDLTSFRATWQPVINASSYLLTVTDADGNIVGEYKDFVVAGATSVDITGLVPGTLYKYSVKTKIENFVSESSSVKEITTLKPLIDPFVIEPFESVAGMPSLQTLTVGATDLYGDISVTISGDDAAVFTLGEGEETIGKDADSKQLHITYTPVKPGIHTAKLTLVSEYAEPVTTILNGTAVLSAPTGLVATQITPDGFTANWDAVMGATVYELTVVTVEGEPVDGYIAKEVDTATFCQITGLNPATEYIFKIIAKYGEFVSPEAVSEAITTSVVPVIETPVISKFATEVSVVAEQQITVSATDLYGDITVSIMGADADKFDTDVVILDKLGLKQITITYESEEAGEHEAILSLTSDYAQSVNVTLNGTSSLAKPVIAVGDVCEGKIPVSWNAVAGAAEYHVTLYKGETPVDGYDNIVTDETNFTFMDLTGSTQYFVVITALSGNYFTASEKIAVMTLPTGLSTTSAEVVTIYPNPVVSNIFIKGIVAKEAKIYSVNGRLLMSVSPVDNKIDVSSLVQGIYSILIKSDTDVVRLQFIKK